MEGGLLAYIGILLAYIGMCCSTGYTFYPFDWSGTGYKITLYLWKKGILYFCLTLKQGQFSGYSWSSFGDKLHVRSRHHFYMTEPVTTICLEQGRKCTSFLSGTGLESQ